MLEQSRLYTIYTFLWIYVIYYALGYVVCVRVCVCTEVFGWCSFLLFWFDFLPLLRMFILCKYAHYTHIYFVNGADVHALTQRCIKKNTQFLSLFLSLSLSRFCLRFLEAGITFVSSSFFVLDIFLIFLFFRCFFSLLCLSQCPWFCSTNKNHHHFTKSTGYFVY